MFQRLVLFMLFFVVTGCAHQISSIDSKQTIANGIQACATHHGLKGNQKVSVVDSSNLAYYIILSEELNVADQISNNGQLITSKSRKYCHVGKLSQSLIYANSQTPFLKYSPDSDEYATTYKRLTTGQASLGITTILQYKLIANQWRYIGQESLKVF